MAIVQMEFSVRGTSVEVTGGTVVLLLVGLAFVAYGGYDYAQQSAAVDDAVSVEATIVETDVSQSDGRSSANYHAHVEFTYQHEGTEYTGDRLVPGATSPSYDTRSEAESAIEPYDAGETVTAYVDPADPGEGFLERRTTGGPPVFVAIGGVVLLLTSLNAAGAKNPGQGTALRPASEREPARYRTLFGVDRSAVNRISKRLIAGAVIVVPLSMVGVAILLFASQGADGGSSSVQVGLSDPVGVLLVAAFVGMLALVASILLYGVWSFTEYRRLRERIREPRPPSPFKHPTRLVTILVGDHDLDAYGTRVKRTGSVLVVALFLVGVLLELLAF